RNVFRAAHGRRDLEITAVNDITDPSTLAHLLKYDSILGNYPGKVSPDGDALTVDGTRVKVFAEKDPGNLPWRDLGIDIVIESTGLFTDATKAKVHIERGGARAGSLAVIPDRTGGGTAMAPVMAEAKGKFHGVSLRVPPPDVSLVGLSVVTRDPVSAETINEALREAAASDLKGILAVTEEELVSSDFKGNSNSSIVDAPLTMVIGDRHGKVFSWYDNEWGYSCRVVDLAVFMGDRLN